MKTNCSRCKTGHRVSGNSWCRPCLQQGQAKWKANNPMAVAQHRAKDKKKHNLRRKYGITHEDKANILVRQDNKCAACSIVLDLFNNRDFCIDHCHSSKAVRGILCYGCNISLGFMKENSERIRKLADYIDQFKLKTG
jgi:hypothetical protein